VIPSLDELGPRIERVALDPAGIDEQLLFRVARPLLAIAGWRAKVRYAALMALFPALRAAHKPDESTVINARAAQLAAVAELATNVESVERAAIVRRKAPVGHAAWLRRVWELLVSADRALTKLEEGAPDADALRRTSGADLIGVLPPLGLRVKAKNEDEEKKEDETADAERTPIFTADVATRDPVPAADADVRIVELELAAIDHLLAAARDERSMLGRRRRLLVAARQRLLDVSAALPLDREGARTRASFIAKEIVRIDRLESVGLSADVGLAHQARQAIDRGDPRRLYAALAAIDTAALATNDAAVTSVTARAISRMWDGADPTSPEAVEASLQASASELLGADVVSAVQDEIRAVQAAATERHASSKDKVEQLAAGEPLVYFAGADVDLLRSTVAMDGCFEVGGALSAVRIVEEDRYLQQVRHPTQELVLVTAHDAHDLPDAIISDPRSVLLDLATGRLLARRFAREEVRRRTRVIARSEVRVYVLDGSGSMRGPRARVRDALLIAELATLIARLKAPGEVRCTLFFRYFDEELGPVTRVDTVASAKAAIRDVVGSMRSGGTDIQKALLASLEQVEVARELDHELSRAQIVLVTDGEAAVDEEAVVAARAVLDGLPIGVSVIALGEENLALRGLVARQRARGEPAFYHFLDDEQLATIANGALDRDGALHLPAAAARNTTTIARELEAELGPLVEELRTIERERDIAALERLDAEVQARREAGLPDTAAASSTSEGERARIEALHRDRASLAVRFARWFPPAGDQAAAARPPKGTKERDEVDAVVCALLSIAEVVMLVGGPELARRAEAIELLERLLPDAQVTPARYRELLREWSGAIAPALGAVHAAASPV
jgi:hypothetical protein